jgi:hypothetical protein
VVTCERQLAIGVDGRNDYRSRTLAFPLGCHHNLAGGSSKDEIRGKQRSVLKRKCEVRAQNSRAHDDMSINGVFPGWAPFLKSAKSSLGKTRFPTVPAIARLLYLKRRQSQIPLGRYL